MIWVFNETNEHNKKARKIQSKFEKQFPLRSQEGNRAGEADQKDFYLIYLLICNYKLSSKPVHRQVGLLAQYLFYSVNFPWEL